MSDTRAPRPTDLVALVTFDGEVRENLAVTRERLVAPAAAPKPLPAAIEQWLHLGRRMWVSMAGRQIRGIATARELGTRHAWEIDTLIDADEARGDGAVLTDLLRQVILAAEQAKATHLLLRTAVDGPAVEVALRCGFASVVAERLWAGCLQEAVDPGTVVRRSTEADEFASFQVYSRALSVAARQSLAMTLDEWHAVRDRHWQERGDGALLAEREGRVEATARYARSSGQFTLVAEPQAASTDALVAALARRLAGAGRHVALVAACGATEEAALRRAGLVPQQEFVLLCRRIARPVREETYARAGIPITGG
ncbi:MAG: hypothetical protein EXR64_04400 [Dehalococcoidia bacterium]|nr:hypothetical protein [Dehalococcoidia bacterium]